MTRHRNLLMIISLVLLGAGFYLYGRMPLYAAVSLILGIILFPHKKKSGYAIPVKIILIAALAALFYRYHYQEPASGENGYLSVTFIDIGQGDSILLQFPDGKTVLIDGGLQEYGSKVVSVLKANNIRKLDLLIASHPHADHIGGLPEVMANIKTEEVITPMIPEALLPDTWTYRHFNETAAKLQIPQKTASGGDVLLEGVNYRLIALNPSESLQSEDLNDYSLMSRLSFGNTVFLFTADAGYSAELELLDQNLKTDVLQVGHHGSFGSTCTAFLNETDPSYGVISVGEGNDHNLPNAYVLERLSDYGVRVYRTDYDGSITFISDGKNITVSTEKEAAENR